MAFFQLNKPGHGKWTRILTASGIGVIVVFGLTWILGEMDGWMGPRSQITNVTPSGEIGGQTFTVNASYTDNDGKKVVGSVSYRAETADDVKAVVGALHRRMDTDNTSTVWKMAVPSVVDSDKSLRLTGNVTGVQFDIESSATGNAQLVAVMATTARSGDATIAKGITAAVVLILFGAFTWWLLNKETIVDFMGATETEMRKVNWPTKKEIIGSTWVVIFGTLFITAILFIVDFGFFALFTNIGILHAGGK